MDNFDLKKYLAEGRIHLKEVNEDINYDENLSQNLIKVYEDEIESLMASDEDDVVPALKMGIASLQRGEDPNKVNIATAKKVAQIQGEFDFDEFARIYMNNAQLKEVKEDINYDVFDEKEEFEEQTIDVQSMAAPLESALTDRGLEDLDDLNSMDDFLSFIKYLEEYVSNEIPSEFFTLKPIEQVRMLSQAQMYI